MSKVSQTDFVGGSGAGDFTASLTSSSITYLGGDVGLSSSIGAGLKGIVTKPLSLVMFFWTKISSAISPN
jgi:hypothetical protein